MRRSRGSKSMPLLGSFFSSSPTLKVGCCSPTGIGSLTPSSECSDSPGGMFTSPPQLGQGEAGYGMGLPQDGHGLVGLTWDGGTFEPELKRTCAASRRDGRAAGMRAVDVTRAEGRETVLRRNMVAEVESAMENCRTRRRNRDVIYRPRPPRRALHPQSPPLTCAARVTGFAAALMSKSTARSCPASPKPSCSEPQVHARFLLI